MKKTLLVLALTLFGTMAMAKPVDVNTAQRVAQNFWNSHRDNGIAAVTTPMSVVATPFDGFYIFSASANGGFVIVAADDCVQPVLGYSFTSPTSERINPEARYWLGTYQEQIDYLRSIEYEAPQDVVAQWTLYAAANATPTPEPLTAVSPLLSTTWDQSPYYNNLCPYDNTYNERTVTGCVATATAQVMKYWNHPTQGTGNHSYTHDDYGTLSANFATTTYQWSNMPNALTSTSSTTQVTAVATLMYHIGVAIEMDYGVASTGGSGAYTNNYGYSNIPCAQNALSDYFGSQLVNCYYRDDVTDAVWAGYLNTELNASRPVIYAGQDTAGGHCFVCDGYNNSNYYHFNWGWGGYQDGYYLLSNLAPGSGGTGGNATYTFNLSQRILTGVQPDTTYTPSNPLSPDPDCLISSFPYTETFDDTTHYSCLRIYDANGDGTTWSVIDSFGTNYSTAAFISYAEDADDYLILPGITTPGNYTITWKARIYHSSYPETYQVYAGSSNMIFSETLSSTSLVTRTANFSVTAGDTVLPMFRYISDDMYAFFIDDVTISQAVPQYTITVQSANPTMGSVSGGGTYNSGSNVTISATPFSGYQFTQWQDGNTNASRTITVTGNATYTAYFEASSTPATADTVSYCGNSAYASSIGAGGTLYWGIKLTSSQLTGANYLKSVMLFVSSPGTYTLRVHRGGASAPGTLAHTQTVTFGAADTLWQEIQLDATFALTSGQDIWITFYNTGVSYPAASCSYTGNTNSDWTSVDDTEWDHLQNLASTLTYSWLIKAVTTQTIPDLPAPTVNISGQQQLAMGSAYTFTANAPEGATISWSLPGATPSYGTGSTITATYSASGLYNVIASATNSHGTGTDTMQVLVVNYTVGDTLSYALNRGMYTNVGTGDAGAFSWGIMLPSAFLSGRNQVSKVLVGAKEPGTYTVRLYQGGTSAPQTLVHTGTLNVTSADTANLYTVYTPSSPVSINSSNNLWVVIHTSGLNYPARSCAHTTDTNSDWTSLNDTAWYHLPQLGINASWMIKVVAASVTPTYTLTVQSADPTMGTANGSGTYNSGTSVTISAIANNGYHFTQWQDGNTNATRTVTVTANATYTAYFAANAPDTYTITVLSNNDAWGTVSGGGTYTAGSTATISAVANSGYRFVQWQDGNTNATRTITVTGDATYIATFESNQTQQYTITVLANNDEWGNVTGGGTYTAGSTVTIRAIAYSGYQFDQWNDGNANATRTITVTGDATYIATFSATNGIDNAEAAEWSLYPNPASSVVSINGIGKGEATITDLTGRTVATVAIDADNTDIDISHLTPGAYFVRISAEGVSSVRKLIVK